MKKTCFFRIAVLTAVCLVLLQAAPVLAIGGVRTHEIGSQTAELATYAFAADAVDFSESYQYYDQLRSDDQRVLYGLLLEAEPGEELVLELSDVPSLPPYGDASLEEALIAHLAEVALPAYAAAVMDEPMLFWTGSISYSCTFSVLGTEVVGITLYCTPIIADAFLETDPSEARQRIENELDMLVFEQRSREDMLRDFHDHLCNTVVYTDAAYAHNVYGALVAREAVCEGYAKALKLLCDRYGIPCMVITGNAVTSDGAGPHAWNAVRMEDGSWYGIDVTWDDQNEIYYDFFLIGTESVPESFNRITFAESHIEISDFFGNGAVSFAFPTLSAQAYTHTHIYDGGTVTLAPSCTEEGECAFACLTCGVSYTETVPASGHSYEGGSCVSCGEPDPTLLYGDCNGDGVISGKDATRLLRYLADYDDETGTSSVEITLGADTNGDGTVNGKDVTRLLRYLADYDEVTGTSSVTLGK